MAWQHTIALTVCWGCAWYSDCALYRHRRKTTDGSLPPADAAQARAQYKHWVQQYSKPSLDGFTLVITVVVGDEKQAKERAENSFGTGIYTYTCNVSAKGMPAMFRSRDRRCQGAAAAPRSRRPS